MSSRARVKRLVRRKGALIAIVLVGFFAGIAILAPVLSPYPNAYRPGAWYASSILSIPGWATALPWYHDYSKTILVPATKASEFKIMSLSPYWDATVSGLGSSSVRVFLNDSTGPVDITTSKTATTLVNTGAGSLEITVTNNSSVDANVTLETTFNYRNIPGSLTLQYAVMPKLHGGNVEVDAYLVSPGGATYWLSQSGVSPTINTSQAFQQLSDGKWRLSASTTLAPDTVPWTYTLSPGQLPLATQLFSKNAFSKSGTYTLKFVITLTGHGGGDVFFSDARLAVLGNSYGILGTDSEGASVWAEFVYGTRFSLFIGLVASLLIISTGLAIGLVAGYFGGFIDLGLVALNDVLLVIPFLPLLITLGALVYALHVNISRTILIMGLITLLSWPFTARIIRSQTLSLRTKAYVTASRGLGASSYKIIMRHILPDLIGVLFAQLALDVPAVIGIEAGLDYLGLGITSFPTWGNMIGLSSALFSAQNSYLWWWILPPGLALMVLGISFYALGEAVRQEWGIRRSSSR